MNIIFIFIYVLLDVFLFPNRDHIPVLFWKLEYKGRSIYPVYRLFQFLLFAAGCYYLWQYTNWYETTGYVLAFVLLTTDLLYYAFKWQWQELLDMSVRYTDVYWLNHPWQAGILLFRTGFSFWKFMLSGLTGLALLIISNLI